MPITIEVDSKTVQEALTQLGGQLADMTPVMRNIAGALADGIEQNFENERDPVTGTPWKRLSNVTIGIREKSGHWPGKKLQVSGHLATSITPQFGADFATSGTNVVYAITQQFGASKGQFGKTGRGAPIPWGDIPPRPFIGFSAADEEEVLRIVNKHLLASLGEAFKQERAPAGFARVWTMLRTVCIEDGQPVDNKKPLPTACPRSSHTSPTPSRCHYC